MYIHTKILGENLKGVRHHLWWLFIYSDVYTGDPPRGNYKVNRNYFRPPGALQQQRFLYIHVAADARVQRCDRCIAPAIAYTYLYMCAGVEAFNWHCAAYTRGSPYSFFLYIRSRACIMHISNRGGEFITQISPAYTNHARFIISNWQSRIIRTFIKRIYTLYAVRVLVTTI